MSESWKLYLNGRLCNGSSRFKRTEEERNQYTVDELRQISKDNGIKVVSGLTKTEICQAILDFAKKKEPMIVGPPIVEEPVAAVPLMVRQNSGLKPLNHLKIDATTISSISGPVSFYYFRPTNKLSKLPLIMLFGDFHRTRNNMCIKCSCSKDKKSCCYKLSDPRFLKLFDVVASRFPIDFYTETSFLGTGSGFKNGEMEILTTGDMTSCYHHLLRGTKYDKCPTRNIRWHAGDIRQASYDYNYKYGDQINSTNTAAEYATTSNNYRNNLYVETQLSVIFDMIKSGEKMTEEDFQYTRFKSFEGFKSFILILFGPEDKEEDDFDLEDLASFAHDLFDFGRYSAINKQIQKQSLDELKNRQAWILLYAYTLKKNFDTLRSGLKPHIKTALQSTTLENINEQDIKSFWNIIGFRVTVPLLDMYVLARMFKQPTDGYASSLSIAYFGNKHIENILDLLNNLDQILDIKDSKYELVARIDATDKDEFKASRCLTMPPIDLNDQLFKHTIQRSNIWL